MYLKDYLEQYKDKKIKLFVDMDGVIADYIFGSAEDYDKKRPLYDSIKKLEEISKMSNVELYIFSATRYSIGFKQKQWWLDNYAPFFKKENRIIISREENNMTDSSILKAQYLQNIKRDGSVLILIDDDPKNLKDVRNLNEDIVLLKDTVLVDDTAMKLQDVSVNRINEDILELRRNGASPKKVSDKYHTFEDYVDIRNLWFVAYCNERSDISGKSKKHYDEETDPMSNFNDDFIAWVNTPMGTVAQHLKMKYWDLLDVPEYERGPKYDGYTFEDSKKRIMSLFTKRK